MKKSLLVGLATGLFMSYMVGVASATSLIDTTTTTAGTGYDYINSGTNYGQTFTQIHDNISGAGFYMALGPSGYVTIGLWDSYGGTLIIEATTSAQVSARSWADVFFTTPEQLVTGQSYYLSVKSNVPLLAGYLSGSYGYGGGNLMANGSASTRNDFGFRTYYDDSSSPVPEPATMLLFGTGVAGLAGNQLRRKKKEA